MKQPNSNLLKEIETNLKHFHRSIIDIGFIKETNIIIVKIPNKISTKMSKKLYFLHWFLMRKLMYRFLLIKPIFKHITITPFVNTLKCQLSPSLPLVIKGPFP